MGERRHGARGGGLILFVGGVLAASGVSMMACTPPQGQVSPEAIPVELGPGRGGVYTLGTMVGTDPGGGGNFSLLVDTGTVLTTRAVGMSGSAPVGIAPLTLQLLDDTGVPRVEFDSVPVLESPLTPVGVGTNLLDLKSGGILGGDLLQRFSMVLDYSGPTIALGVAELACSCALADSCVGVLPFQLAGGGSLAIGDSVYSYPATRVTIDACLEPVVDPVASGVKCVGADGTHQPGYESIGPPGVDVKLLVATGFPGVLLGAKAYDRLRGQGAAEALLAGGTVPLYFPGQTAAVPAARAWLGATPPGSTGDGGVADAGVVADAGAVSDAGARDGGTSASSASTLALALVGLEGLLGPCAELARSRRIRYTAAHVGDDPTAAALPPRCGGYDPTCPDPTQSCLVCLPGSACSPGSCNDARQPAATVVELLDSIPIYVVDDTAPILQEVNFDVSPVLAEVEGVVGTELLSRLSARIDYPNSRIVASCASSSAGCTVYPRYVCPDQVNDCGPRGSDADSVCYPPSCIPAFSPSVGASAAPLCVAQFPAGDTCGPPSNN